MKIQRYQYGRSNVAQLENQKANLIKAPEAAAAAMVPYEAVSSAAQNISNDLFKLAEREKQNIRDESVLNAKIANEKLKVAITELENDPAYMNQMQKESIPSPDGPIRSTAAVMLQKYGEIESAYKQEISQIEDPKVREEALKMAEIGSKAGQLAVRNMVNDRRKAWNAQGMFDLRSVQFDAQDWGAFQQTNQEMLDQGLISQEQFATAENRMTAQRQQVTTLDILKNYEQDIAAGRGDQVLAAILAKPNKDPDIQKMLIAGVKAQTENYKLAEQKAKDAMVASWMIETNNLITSIKEEGKMVNLDSLMASMVGTGLDPIKAATLRNQVAVAMRKKEVGNDRYTEFKAKVATNTPLDNDAANREDVDRYVAGQLEARPDDRPIDVVIDTYKAIGLVGQDWQTRLESAFSAEGLAQSAEFWSALHADKYRQVEDGLSGERRGMYEMIERRAKDGGMSWIDASRDVLDITKMDETQREIRKQKWEEDDDGADYAEKYYGKMMDSNTYDRSNIPFHSGVDKIDDEVNLAHYRMYLQDGFVLTGNWPDARSHADQVFKKSHVLTNINGDLEMQIGGIPMDLGNGSDVNLSDLRDKFVAGIKGKQMMFTDADGGTKLGTIESAEGLTLDDPEERLNEWFYKVSMNGNRIINPQTGDQLEVSFDSADLYELQVKQSAQLDNKQFRASQAKIQSTIESLNADLQFYSKGNKESPEVRKLIKDKEQAIKRNEDLMMEKERQRKTETAGLPGF